MNLTVWRTYNESAFLGSSMSRKKAVHVAKCDTDMSLFCPRKHLYKKTFFTLFLEKNKTRSESPCLVKLSFLAD